MPEETRYEKAIRLSHEAHDSIGHRRKYSDEPYWVHTDRVGSRALAISGDEDDGIVGLFHDVVEDVFPVKPQYSLAWIVSEFGPVVGEGVEALTDVYVKAAYPKLNRRQRHDLENVRLMKLAPRWKTIKLIDLIDNTESIVAHDPDFARVYLHEKLNLLPMLAEGNSALLNEASMQTIASMSKLGLTLPMFSS